jgi:succinoglycan biosynthesis transport protein ExoP
MEEEVKGLGDYLDIIRRHKYLVVFSTLILMIASASIAYLLPATYKSEGLILIESQEIPRDLVKSTVTSYADQRIEVIKQWTMTTSNVMKIVEKFNLYPAMRKKAPVAEVVDLFRLNVDVSMVKANVTDPRSGRARHASIAFNVSFMDGSPQTAQKVANELITGFLNENARTRTERAAQTTTFLDEEASKLQRKVQKLEKDIAEFKDKNSDSLPELLEYNLSMVTRLQDELVTNQNQIMVLKDQIMTMTLEKANLHFYIDAQQPVNNEPTTPQGQLVQAQANFNRLQAKYSPNHPDVLQLKRRIKSLKAELGIDTIGSGSLALELKQAQEELDLLKQRYVANHPDVKAKTNQVASLKAQLKQAGGSQLSAQRTPSVSDKTNPIYLQLSSKVNSSEREIGRLRVRQGEAKAKLEDYERRVVQTHQVKRAYDNLSRDHANHLSKYKELRAKQLEAELAQNLESENKGESFKLIEPPLVPEKAVKPNRTKILAMGIVLSIGSGFGLALLVDMVKGGVRGYNEISRVIGSVPLVVIPMIITEQDHKKKAANRRRLIYLVIILFALMIAGFHFLVMDLEVLWFKVMRKLTSL